MFSSFNRFLFLMLMILFLVGCNLPTGESPAPTATITLTPTVTPSPNPTSTNTPSTTPTVTFSLTPTLTPSETTIPTDTSTPTQTDTPTITNTPTETPSPTVESVTVLAEQNINCRLGPDTVYLLVGLLSEGQTAQVDGRNYPGTWLWIIWEGMGRHCWVAASAVAISGDVQTAPSVPTDPPTNPSVPSASGVQASRNGNNVTITWNPSPPAVELHYLIQANICNGQYVIEWVDTTTNTAYTVQDQKTCSGTSSAKVYTVNKLGYSSPVNVPWP